MKAKTETLSAIRKRQKIEHGKRQDTAAIVAAVSASKADTTMAAAMRAAVGR